MGNKQSIFCCTICTSSTCSRDNTRRQRAGDFRHGAKERSGHRASPVSPHGASSSSVSSKTSLSAIPQEQLEGKIEKLRLEIEKELKIQEGAKKIQKATTNKKHLKSVKKFVDKSGKRLEKLYFSLQELYAHKAVREAEDLPGEPLPEASQADNTVTVGSDARVLQLHRATSEPLLSSIDHDRTHLRFLSEPSIPTLGKDHEQEAEKSSAQPSQCGKSLSEPLLVTVDYELKPVRFYSEPIIPPMGHDHQQEASPAPSEKTPAELPQCQNSKADIEQVVEVWMSPDPSPPGISQPAPPISLQDFQCCAVIGRGAFGKVLLAEHKTTKEMFALKAIKKGQLLSSGLVKHLMYEKHILETISSERHPFLVNSFASFQTREHAIFAMEFAAGGDLDMSLSTCGVFPEPRAMFYASCICLGLEYLHQLKIVHRDLKMENIVMCSDGYVKITDFGFCKGGMGFGDKTRSMCGSLPYCAPEIIKYSPYTRAVDWWSFGCLIFAMLVGRTPFSGKNQRELIKNILEQKVNYPQFLSPNATLILSRLLKKKPRKRLGSSKKDAKDVKEHVFFNEIDWMKLLSKEIKPPVLPNITSPKDVSHFNEDLRRQEPVLSSHVQKAFTAKEQDMFKEFDWMADWAM